MWVFLCPNLNFQDKCRVLFSSVIFNHVIYFQNTAKTIEKRLKSVVAISNKLASDIVVAVQV